MSWKPDVTGTKRCRELSSPDHIENSGVRLVARVAMLTCTVGALAAAALVAMWLDNQLQDERETLDEKS